MQYAKVSGKKCVFAPTFLVYREKYTKGSETFFKFILYGKKCFPTETIPPAFISDVKILLLAEKLGKHLKFITFFVYTMDKIPALFQTWSLTHSQNSRRLITFFRSEIINRYTNPAYVSRILCFIMT